MIRCVMLYNNSENCNITLLNDDNVVVNCMGNYSLDSFLFNTGVNSLHVIYKPSIENAVPENGFKIGNVSLNNVLKSCVISNEDVKRLPFLSLYGIEDVRLYNYLDLVADRYKTEENILVVFEWIGNIVGVAHIQMGEILEFRRVAEEKLTAVLSKLRDKHNCNVVQFNSGFDITGCYCNIHNLKLVDKDKQIFLSHIPYVIENKGIEILEDKKAKSILNAFNDKEGEDYSIYNTSSDDESNYEVALDLDNNIRSNVINTPVKKLGFFARLFEKKVVDYSMFSELDD